MFIMFIPPVSDCFMPTLGAAQILGYLRERNLKCNLCDLNIEFMNYISSCCDRYDTDYLKIIATVPHNHPQRKMKAMLNLLSATQENFDISMENFTIHKNIKDSVAIKNYLNSQSELEEILSSLSSLSIEDGVKFIGFSISYESQFFLSLLLSKIIKTSRQDIKIITGGAFFYSFLDKYLPLIADLKLWDVVVKGPGEVVVEKIIKNNIHELTNDGTVVSYRDKLMIIDSTTAHGIPMVYSPYFESINFNDYPTEEKAFPYIINNRCYYGKCKFCSGDKVNNQSFAKDVVQSFCSIKKIADSIKVNNVYIVDAAFSPSDMRKILTLDFDKNIHWIANARFEKSMENAHLWNGLKKKGCTMVRFGLESGSQRMLDLMCKGTSITTVSNILKMSHCAGIKNHVYIMFGFPGELPQDRQLTIEFMDAHKEYIYSYSISVFEPYPNTSIYNELSEKIGCNTDIYEKMIDVIYPSESFFDSIVNDIKILNMSLMGTCKTNGEWGQGKHSGELYSANIFSEERGGYDELVVNSNMLIYPSNEKMGRLSLRVNYHISDNNSSADNDDAVVIDLINNVKIMLHIPKWLIEILSKGYAGRISAFLSDVCESEKLLDLLLILSTYSDFVNFNTTMHKSDENYFTIT